MRFNLTENRLKTMPRCGVDRFVNQGLFGRARLLGEPFFCIVDRLAVGP